MRIRIYSVALSFLGTLLSLGCATWDAPSESSILPAPKLAPDGVVLEVEFVRVPAASTAKFAQLWSDVDEQQLPLEVRRRLDANGLRCGVVGFQLPVFVRDLLDAEKPAHELLADGDLAEDTELFSNYQRLQSRTGSRKKIVASPQMHGRTVVILNQDGELRGEPFEEAQGMFMVSTYPQGDGRVRLVITPLIESGESQARWIAVRGSLVMQTGRQQTEFDQMRIDTLLSPGQTLIVTGGPVPRGLGGFVFADSVGPSDRSMMLIRLAQSQYDDLWSEQRKLSPLTTRIE